jgi:hypothetical protein
MLDRSQALKESKVKKLHKTANNATKLEIPKISAHIYENGT